MKNISAETCRPAVPLLDCGEKHQNETPGVSAVLAMAQRKRKVAMWNWQAVLSLLLCGWEGGEARESKMQAATGEFPSSLSANVSAVDRLQHCVLSHFL